MKNKTDLIVEIATLIEEEPQGYEIKVENKNKDILKTYIEIKTEVGSKLFNKEVGHYITLDSKNLFLKEEVEELLIKELSVSIKELMSILKRENAKNVLVVGVGNKQMVSDSLGLKVVENITITRHINEVINEKKETNLTSVSAIATGVLGTTGIETSNIVSLIVKEVKPELVIVIDTLSTLESSRVATSFQLTNVGIIPGGGVGNKRKSINEKTLGVPVIVIGVPLVIYAYSICKEVLDKVKEGKVEELEKAFLNKADALLKDLIVTTKEVDSAVEKCASIIAKSLDLTLNKELMDEHKNLK